MADNADPQFCRFSAAKLDKIAADLTEWLSEWQEGEFPPDTFGPEEYPFTRAWSLEDLIAQCQGSAERLRERAEQPEPDTSDTRIYPSLNWLEDHGYAPDPRGDPMTWQEVAEHYADLLMTTPRERALRRFREMVTAFGGGYHPDTRPACYVDYPQGYNATNITDIENDARAQGIHLASEALKVLNEVHDG